MKNILKSELYEFIRDKKYLILLVISIILQSVLLLDKYIKNTSEMIYHSFYNMPLLFIVVNVFIALYIGGNFSDRKINRYIISGHKRANIVIVETFIVVIFSNLILMLQPTIATIVSLATNGNGTDSTNILEIFLVTLLLNTSFLMITIFLAFLFKDIGKTLASSVGMYFIVIFLLNSNNAVQLAHFIPIGQGRLLIENSTNMIEAIILASVYFFVFLVGTMEYFKKCDLK
ncbi:ABC transporter permease [Anaerococcus nagyae]|uniref:ABC transporter permease n=1 Tax=Anaerococcus nagyae TaxID=1755241 RepID=A0A3E2THQ1_9FIRM|nr:ABC transporter permease [Anaerococcus nagyae]RGB75942.1 ABC transporter permease [Anaerococcus nagyae]